MSDQFPYSPTSRKIATSIDWLLASSQSWDAPLSVWKKVPAKDIKRLTQEPKYARLYSSLPETVKEKLVAVMEERPVATTPSRGGSTKEDILERIEAVLEDAESKGDTTGRLNGIKLLAQVQSLLNQKAEQDTTVNITVISGVERDQ